MPSPSQKGTSVLSRNRTWLSAAAVSGTVVAVTMLGVPSNASSSGSSSGGDAAVSSRGPLAQQSDRLDNYDARQLSGNSLYHADQAQATSQTRADSAYYRSLGAEAV